MGERYFPVTALGGRLYIDGISERGPWNTAGLRYQDEAMVELLATRVGHRKTLTAQELWKVVQESESGLASIRMWVREGLEEAARKLWEEAPTPLWFVDCKGSET
jgi:hypothetical protein